MRITFTPGQVAMLIGRAERQLEQILADSQHNSGNGSGRNIARASHHMLHETVVTLIRLYREQVPGGGAAATRIARAYAKGADAQTGAPTLACVRTILSLMRDSHALLAPAQPELPPEAPPPQRSANMTIG